MACSGCENKLMWVYEATHNPATREINAVVYADMDRLVVPPLPENITGLLLEHFQLPLDSGNGFPDTTWYTIHNTRGQRLVGIGWQVNY